MKSKILVIAIFLTVTACGKKDGARPSAPMKPGQSSSTPAPTPDQQFQSSEVEIAAINQLHKSQELLISMGVKVNGKDIIVPFEPTTYKNAKDLKLAFETYRNAAQELANVSVQPDKKAFAQGVFESASGYTERYTTMLNNFYFDDLERIGTSESNLSAVGIVKKKVDRNWVYVIEKDFNYYYSRAEQRKVLQSFISRIEGFLENYSDGQSHLNFETKALLEKKIEMAKALADTLN